MKTPLQNQLTTMSFLLLLACLTLACAVTSTNEKPEPEILHNFPPENKIMAKDIWEREFPHPLWQPYYVDFSNDVLIYQVKPRKLNTKEVVLSFETGNRYTKAIELEDIDYGQFFFSGKEVPQISTQRPNWLVNREFNKTLYIRKHSKKTGKWFFDSDHRHLEEQFIALGKKIESKRLGIHCGTNKLSQCTRYTKIETLNQGKTQTNYYTYLYFNPNLKINPKGGGRGYLAYLDFFSMGQIQLIHPDMMFISFPGVNKVFRLNHDGLPVTKDKNLVVLKFNQKIKDENLLNTADYKRLYPIGSHPCHNLSKANKKSSIYFGAYDQFQMKLVKKMKLDPNWEKTNHLLKDHVEHIRCIEYFGITNE